LDIVLDGNDNQTFYSLGRLRDIIVEGSKPLVFWVGAGASRWCGYPSWYELAKSLHSRFSKAERRYDRATGSQLIDKDLPKVFSLCRSINSQLYYQSLATSFLPRKDTPIYKTFLDTLSYNDPLYILTTNVEEMLEQHLPSAAIVQRTDFERCISLMQQKQSFVCKLHGSISMIQSTVFTTEDYAELETDEAYLALLKHVFAESTVVFVGYGLKDEYVIKALRAIEARTRIFGNGPHFLTSGSPPTDLPNSITPLKYLVNAHNDHRSAITILNVIRECRKDNSFAMPKGDHVSSIVEPTSGYYISDFTPPGTWTSSQTLTFEVDDGSHQHAIVGQGFAQQELPTSIAWSPRDFLVGLVCFDRVYLPLGALAPLHNFVGGEFFWELAATDAVQFIHLPKEPSCLYESAQSQLCSLGLLGATSESGRIRSPQEEIRRQITFVRGREAEAERLVRNLEAKILIFDNETWNVPALARGALLHPSVRRLIGMSDGVRPTDIPRWLVFPALRVAHVVSTAMLCQQFNLAAAKVWFGGEMLVGAIFGLAAARDWAQEAASYVIAGQADVDISPMFNLTLLKTILKFRETQEGIALRKEALDKLKVNAGSEFVSSVNAGLKGNVGFGPLDKSRRVFSTLLTAESRRPQLTLGIWHNPYYSDAAISLWRRRSSQELDAFCTERHIGIYDQCPCGSGEKLKFCCREALS
jgi:hypothetical protein